MATVYGSTMASTWRAYLTYTITETPTTYKITIDDCGVSLVGTTYYLDYDNSDAKLTLKSGSYTDTSTYWFQPTKKTTSWKSAAGLSVPTVTINKTTATQTHTMSFSIYIARWMRGKGSTATDQGASTSTASVTLTIPALAKPTITLTGLRHSDVDTTATFTATVSSFSGDSISSVRLTIDGTEYGMGTGVMGSSGVLTFTRTIEELSINRVPATLVATGRGGVSDTYTYYLPSAFYTMDIGGKGKEIAFGCPATDEDLPEAGRFRCAMETVFENEVYKGSEKLVTDGKLKKILSTGYTIPVTVTNGTFTNSSTSAVLVGNTLRIILSCTANAAKTAGNITNETMLTIKITDSRIKGLWGISNAGASSGPNAQIYFGVSSADGVHTITVTLAAIAQNISKGGSVNCYAGLPCTINWDAF